LSLAGGASSGSRSDDDARERRSHTSLIGHPSSTTRRATFKRWRGVSAALACVIVPPVMAAEKRQGPEPVQGRAGECRARWDWTRSPRESVVNGGRAQFWVRWTPGWVEHSCLLRSSTVVI